MLEILPSSDETPFNILSWNVVPTVDHAGVAGEEISSEGRLAGAVGCSDDDAPGRFG